MNPKNHDEKHPQKPVAKLPQTPEGAPEEVGGSGKAEPTRYGDWEVNGRCSDF